jgi:hypothetical protein
MQQLNLLSETDLDPSASTESFLIDGYRVLLTYLDKNINYPDVGIPQQNHLTWKYKERGGYVYRILNETGVIVENKIPEPSKDVALACVKIEIKIIKKNHVSTNPS